ncbi:DNA mismatch repair enzyme MutL [Candidatus Termititenax aidoneus]|uniref:DNA mismatch repair protein MutL n=2 Tax=Termititenax aidoneus TaxID=2218524 RepID=A0A388TC93_TERA1|nr:DNA mismatch repair enzyme MutL [Candidatus Termititenax aidoneus]
MLKFGMPRIELLDQNLINQIAAGEVIERPVSVVKELVENALDAGATRITIEIADGGKQLIKVSDNGCGMDAEDLAKCVVRHATSKIKTPEDLFRITTMGFRGEALPSIASVSNMRIISKPQGSAQPYACCLHLQDSAVDRSEKVSAPEGTTVIVQDLFASVPARLKFLKSAETEKSHIRDYLGKLMLSRADVAYTFISDGETALATQGGLAIDPELALRNAIGAVYGSRAAKSLRKVNLVLQDFAVSGYVSDPAVVTGSRSGQVFFVNNRYIISPLLNKAVDAAVSDLVYGGKYPYAVLFIRIAYEQVDVNVHPAKREVRFAESNKVFEAVRAAVRQAYHSYQEPQGRAETGTANLETTPYSAPELNLRYAPSPAANAANIPEYDPMPIQPSAAVFPASNAHPLRILGQANRLFIIALDGEDLLLIDQHAAHERIIYERLKTAERRRDKQLLLVPQNIELGQNLNKVLQENAETLRQFGFEWQDFDGTLLLRAIPLVELKNPVEQFFRETLEDLSEAAGGRSLPEREDYLLYTMACKAAVKDGDILTMTEMQKLIADLLALPNYQTCPHGRPTITYLGRDELARRFKR